MALNSKGWLAIGLVVVAIVAGGYYGSSGISFGSKAETVATAFATAMEQADYGRVYDSLKPELQKLGSKDNFIQKMKSQYAGQTLKFKDFVEKKGAAYVLLDAATGNETQTISIDLAKVKSSWFIDAFADEAKCSDACKLGTYCRGRDIMECKDVNGDGCTDEVVRKTCEISCSGGDCVTTPPKRENFTLSLSDTIIEYPSKIILLAINNDYSATFQVGYDIVEIGQGATKVLNGLSITVVSTNKAEKKADVRIKEVK
jgi:hypothetical protein